MKKSPLLAAALIAACTLPAQELRESPFAGRRDATNGPEFRLPDSPAEPLPWSPDFRTMKPVDIRPAVSMSSLIVVPKKSLPARITVLDNNTLRLGPHFILSNGQAWNHGSYPDAFLDARTLSFPLPR